MRRIGDLYRCWVDAARHVPHLHGTLALLEIELANVPHDTEVVIIDRKRKRLPFILSERSRSGNEERRDAKEQRSNRLHRDKIEVRFSDGANARTQKLRRSCFAE